MCRKTVTTGRVCRVQVVKFRTHWDNCQYQLIQVYSFNSDANFDSIIQFLAEIVEKLAVFAIFSFLGNDYEISRTEALSDCFI